MRNDSISGLTLREIAQKKLHHGKGRFLNPFGNANHGRLFSVLRWKLFGENRFRTFYEEENLCGGIEKNVEGSCLKFSFKKKYFLEFRCQVLGTTVHRNRRNFEKLIQVKSGESVKSKSGDN